MKTRLLWAVAAPAIATPFVACSSPAVGTGCNHFFDGYYHEYACDDAGSPAPPPQPADAGCDPYYGDCMDAGRVDSGVTPPSSPDAGTSLDAAADGDADAGAGASLDAGGPPPQPTCDAGAVQIVAAGQPYPGIMALDASGIYWFDFSAPNAPPTATLMTLPLAGGVPSVLASVDGAPRSMTVRAGAVYWTDIYSGTVMTVPTTGGTPVTIASGQNQPVGIAADATAVYWTTYAGGAVMKAPLAGGPLVVLADAQGQPGPLAIDAANLYWANGTGEVMSLALAGGAPVTLARAQSAVDVAVDATSVYWANYGTGTGAGTVQSEPIGGGQIVTLLSGLTDPEYVAVDGAAVYVTTGDDAVVSVPAVGGAYTTVALSSTCVGEDPFAIAIGPSLVYWTNTLEGTVLAAPR